MVGKRERWVEVAVVPALNEIKNRTKNIVPIINKVLN